MVATRNRQSALDSSSVAASSLRDAGPSAGLDTTPRRRKRIRSPSPDQQQTLPQGKRRSAPTATTRAAASRDGNTQSPETRRGRSRNEVADSQPTASEDVKTGDSIVSIEPTGNPPDFQDTPADTLAGAEAILDNGMTSFPGSANPAISQHAQDEMGLFGAPDLMPHGTNLQVKITSLPILDNLSTQILKIVAGSSYEQLIDMAVKPESEQGKAYSAVKGLFNHSKKLYSATEPFLNAFWLGLTEPAHLETIRRANMATFIISVLGSQDVTFFHLNEFFLDAFVPYSHHIVKAQAELLLELKTHAYVCAIQNGERTREEILEDLFPSDLEHRLLSRRPDARQLVASERDLVSRAANRKKELMDEPNTPDAIRSLLEKYAWINFLRDVLSYISKNFDAITGKATEKSSKPSPKQQTQPTPTANSNPLIDNDIANKAQRAAQHVMQDYNSNRDSVPQTKVNGRELAASTGSQPKGPAIQFHFEHELHPNVPAPQMPYIHTMQYPTIGPSGQWTPGSIDDPSNIPPSQSAPTQVLYERARMAASSKASPVPRRCGGPSQRRPWTLEEENALMAGLDRVKGPHWSQILAMFGPGGTISEVLKDRGQVQLKDKARNLKLFFLKSSIEVPYYLQFVTGELKTRAPAQAAKKEANGKRISEEDRAHVEGIMALAGGPNNAAQQLQQHAAQGLGGMDGRTNGLPEMSNNQNVDPSLDAQYPRMPQSMSKAFSADFIAPTSSSAQGMGGVAPNADMLTGREQRGAISNQQLPWS